MIAEETRVYVTNALKSNTKQVCEKIRNVIDDPNICIELDAYNRLTDVLDQIERGNNGTDTK